MYSFTQTPFNDHTFSLNGGASDGLTYFVISPTTGVITLTRSLVGSGPDSFTVSNKMIIPHYSHLSVFVSVTYLGIINTLSALFHLNW